MKRYRILFDGTIAAGHDMEQVKKNISDLFKLNSRRTAWLFSGGVKTIKKDLNEQTALRYKRAIEHAGAICTIEEIAQEAHQNPLQTMLTTLEESNALNQTLASASRQHVEDLFDRSLSSGMRVYKPGELINNRYEVRFNTHGGMGMVYLCYDRTHPEPVAIKTIWPERLEKNPHFKDLFCKEALTWIQLEKHYNIVTALYVEEVDNLPAIFLEMIASDKTYGSDLSGYIGKYHFTPEEILKLALQFCDGMIYAEEKFRNMGKVFVHCDIKPANTMMTQDRVLKITDFGMVKSELAEQDTLPGTYGYMSPEQFLREAIDTRADIYSFGCILYELFCEGRRPYMLTPEERENANPAAVEGLMQIKHLDEPLIDPVPFLPKSKVQQGIRSVLIRCLEKDRENRFANFRELREVLEELYLSLTGKTIIPVEGEQLETFELANKGYSLDYLGRSEDALDCCDQALKINPADRTAWLNKGVALDHLQRSEEALACYEQVLTLNPDDPEAWYNKGCVLQETGKRQDALVCYDRALTHTPEFARAWYMKAGNLFRLDRKAEALSCYARTLTINPDDAVVWYDQAIALHDLGKVEESLASYDRVVAINPQDADAWSQKAGILGDSGRLEDALECAEKALTINPAHPAALYNKGILLGKSGKREDALTYLKKAADSAYPQAISALQQLEAFRAESKVWFDKGNAFNQAGRYAEAIACYDRALAINPEDSSSWLNKGSALDASGRYADAIICYEKALTLNPDYANAWTNKGNTFVKLSRVEDALLCYGKALEISPNDASAWYNKGALLYNAARETEAAACLKKASALGFSAARRALQQLGLE